MNDIQVLPWEIQQQRLIYDSVHTRKPDVCVWGGGVMVSF